MTAPMEKYFTVNAVVLKYSDFSESSRILTLLSAVAGTAFAEEDALNDGSP